MSANTLFRSPPNNWVFDNAETHLLGMDCCTNLCGIFLRDTFEAKCPRSKLSLVPEIAEYSIFCPAQRLEFDEKPLGRSGFGQLLNSPWRRKILGRSGFGELLNSPWRRKILDRCGSGELFNFPWRRKTLDWSGFSGLLNLHWRRKILDQSGIGELLNSI